MLEAAKWLSFGGKLFISASFCTVYIFSAELFPTDIRTIGVGCGSMVGRFGGFAAPLMIELQFIEGLLNSYSVNGLNVTVKMCRV